MREETSEKDYTDLYHYSLYTIYTDTDTEKLHICPIFIYALHIYIFSINLTNAFFTFQKRIENNFIFSSCKYLKCTCRYRWQRLQNQKIKLLYLKYSCCLCGSTYVKAFYTIFILIFDYNC